MDIDDMWAVDQRHPMYHQIKNSKIGEMKVELLKLVDYISTTTPIFADTLKKRLGVNNVIVFPNAVNDEEPQFKSTPIKSDKIRFGWLGGSSHLYDLELMQNGISSTHNSFKDKVQFVLCGFDLRGNITEINRDTGEQKTRKILPHESVWVRYEESFTNEYNNLDENYIKSLKKYDREFDEDNKIKDKMYRRVWTKPITTYASNYNLFDVSMAPLKEHMFNKVKSQLKVIEAGFHKKALIAQNFGPYQIDCVNIIEYGGKINENGNSILVDTSKNHKDWYKSMKKLYDNPELVDLMGNNLYNLVNEKYHIDVVTKNRAFFYQEIVKDNKKELGQLIEHTNAI
jgi:glycosyltransferase involved in cell wall biosynthesis